MPGTGVTPVTVLQQENELFAIPDCRHISRANTSTTAGGEQSIAATYTGGAWTASTVPAPTGEPDSTLSSVSCEGSTFCVAVGAESPTVTATTVGAAKATPLIEQWNGSTWTTTGAPSPGTTRDELLSGLSCASPSLCMAGGQNDPSALSLVASTARSGYDEGQ